MELISRFEFEFRRCGIFFFEGFEFLVCSCECAVAFLCPRNSFSNVVVSLVTQKEIFIRDVARNMKPLWKVKGFFNRTSWKVSDVRIVRYSWVLTSFSVSLSLCLSVCLCVCVSVSVCCVLLWCSWLWLWWWWREERKREGGRRRRETNRTIWAKVSHKVAETEQPHMLKRKIGGIGWERSKSFFGEPLKHVITIRGQMLVSRTGDDSLPAVCGFKTSPCVDSKCPRAYRHHAHMLKHMCAWCRYARGRFECTHGGVLFSESTHARFFSVPQHTQTHTTTTNNTTTTTTHTTQHNTQHHTETERDRDRDREREKEDGRGETREEKTKENKTRQDRRR